MILNDHFLRLVPYLDYRSPADAERFETKLSETLAIYAEPESQMDIYADDPLPADDQLPALMREQAA